MILAISGPVVTMKVTGPVGRLLVYIIIKGHLATVP